MRKTDLQPTTMQVMKRYNFQNMDSDVDAELSAYDMFAASYPETTELINELSEYGLVLDNGNEITAYIEADVVPMSAHSWTVDIIITLNYFSTEYCSSCEIMRVFNEIFPEIGFNMFIDRYHIESYHI